jgi:glycosyltransferase involved in cell wall biosynthesis
MSGRLKIGLFGASTAGKMFLQCLQFIDSVKVGYFFDNNRRRWNTSIEGITVLPPTPENLKKVDAIYISSTFYTDIAKQLEDIGFGNKIIKSIFSVLNASEIEKARKKFKQAILDTYDGTPLQPNVAIMCDILRFYKQTTGQIRYTNELVKNIAKFDSTMQIEPIYISDLSNGAIQNIPAVIHNPSHLLLIEFLKFPSKKIVTFYDVIVQHTTDIILMGEIFIDHIITISNLMKKKFIRLHNISENKINVIYPAIDHSIFYPRDYAYEYLKGRFDITPPYFFTVASGLDRRKNLKGITSAFSLIARQFPSTKLVIAGKNEDERLDSLFEKDIVSDLVKNRIIRLGYVDEKDLPYLYSACEALVFPSFEEGFGIPVLEAMACGAPVITSSTTATAEVVSDAGILVDPYNTKEIFNAMKAIPENRALRALLVDKGLKRAGYFTLERFIKEHYEIYRKVLPKANLLKLSDLTGAHV